ncbi:transcription initiation factor TFIID subunit 12 [Apium graveolens]|uniref:transcription initiation factor TFIID subunit 12 n=1 Tax=Apium graveolens TaxID=4045 RepID=UPI003D7ADD84
MEPPASTPTPLPTETPPALSTTTTTTTTTSTPQPPPQQTPIPPPQPQPTPPNPNPNPRPPIPQSQQQQQVPTSTIPNTQSRPPYNRPAWAQQTPPSQQQPPPPPHFQHYSASSSSPPVPAFSTSPPVSTLPPRGGMAIGVPATPPPNFSTLSPVQPPQFAGQQFVRNTVAMPDTGPRSITNQLRHPMQGIQVMGSRPGGVPAQHHQRPVQSSLRPLANPNTQPPNAQNFQNHTLLRASSAGSPSSSQSLQPPWLPSGSQGKPPLPPTQYRPPSSTQPPQQRSILPPHHLPIANAQQQQQISSGQQPHPALSHQQQEHYGQQFPPSRIQQSVSHQQQIARGQGTGNQKISSQQMIQSSATQLNPSAAAAVVGSAGESCSRILSKRSIQELVAQIDPSETLDPEVEDILVDIADEFVESITTFGCSLAKHRKSNTLEAKDILLHLERNWNMTLPGFSGDEIKGYRKPSASDIHRERLSAIKRSMLATETTSTKVSGSQAGGNTKGHLKGAANIISSPNLRMRESS